MLLSEFKTFLAGQQLHIHFAKRDSYVIPYIIKIQLECTQINVIYHLCKYYISGTKQNKPSAVTKVAKLASCIAVRFSY